ncbi:translation initiation factor, aIF-2BI family [Pyrolobus fumarii 1A]|uniref:Putative methylthioribose-1-phosphate isomerase n=1 Tax=Pyrolobus fumarii (strain DSM 11204 / 1A) TaxID=694429 RepID=G0EGD2_PYRF1|nr:S-methyl-5-thioribose-1-phosphate isomerase [Pyrolobus fumarii]AEM39157.1 translation initiation factor, aIF-2BI family [Pyrolobus fumarii 1A]
MELDKKLEKLASRLRIRPIEWLDDGRVRWLDVRLIPWEEVYRETRDYRRLAKAIRDMEIRGAPAIGVAAALGLALAAFHSKASNVGELLKDLEEAANVLRETRPTAYNLFWAIDRVLERARRAASESSSVDDVRNAVIEEAKRIMLEDIEANIRMGEIGAKLIQDGDTILTHCNTGALATAGYGTALGVIRAAVEEGKRIRVIATETRPLLQGARLTVWELVKEGIDVTLITDNMVGYVMSKGLVDKVFVGADRITLDGYVANKIGTYTIAVLANRHGVPFYVVAPTSTIDPRLRGPSIPIEERDPDEVRTVVGKVVITVPEVRVLNPAFDVTPPELVTAIITERGIATKPYEKSIPRILGLKEDDGEKGG